MKKHVHTEKDYCVPDLFNSALAQQGLWCPLPGDHNILIYRLFS